MWGYLSGNPNAIDLLEKNKDEIDWSILSINTNPRAIEMLNENQKNIDWFMLSKNPNAIELLKKKGNFKRAILVTKFTGLQSMANLLSLYECILRL